MTTQLLANELANLIQESKRKHNDLRQAAEKSLEELKGLKGVPEAQAAAELGTRINFVNPFIIACGTKNAKFTGIAVVCLQRLIVVKALPRNKLGPVLEALQQATVGAGLDVQLKILQALPSLLQNYASDVKGELLVAALNVCFVLQGSKNAIVNNTSAATLQQLVVSVFDKVVVEDKSSEGTVAGEAPTEDGSVKLRAAALDAYRVFNDLCLLTENQRPEHLRFTGLPQTFGLELIESVLTNHAGVFAQHPEQAHILRRRVMPVIMSGLKHKPNFATSVRLVRILYTLLRRHINSLPTESGEALDLLIHQLDQDTVMWKRALCMEVFRGLFVEHALIRRIFAMYDAREGERDIIRTLTAMFVRISTEKPGVIGRGHQSTLPVSNPGGGSDVMLESGGVTGIISGSVSGDGANTGISTQWSSVRVPCIDQLDKTEPPPIPESYIYSLTLSCISSLSEGLAKFILPLTVPGDRGRKKAKQDVGMDSPAPPVPEESSLEASSGKGLERTPSFKKNPVPVNPLALEDHPLKADIKICAAIIDDCWPAILATCSTFLNSALDSEYFHGLVRAFQKFAHVAGLLQLSTPRDAFLTTLGKTAVPPNLLSSCLNIATPRPTTPTPTSAAESGSILSNARGLLSRENVTTQSQGGTERGNRASADPSATSLNTRNLLCLRALLNLGIALGPALGTSWGIVLETLQQADFVLFCSGKTPGRIPPAVRGQDPQAENEASSLLSNFGAEIKAVETAASRLIESTVDFPNKAFVEVVMAICNLLERDQDDAPTPVSAKAQSPPPTGNSLKAPGKHRRVLSISTSASAGPTQEDMFALAKLGDIAAINIERLLAYAPDTSGWTPLVSELIRVLNSAATNSSVRGRAAEILVRLGLESAKVAAALHTETRGKVQLLLLEAFRDSLVPLQSPERQVSVASHAVDVEIHKILLEGLKSLLEQCGETLVSGWDITFEIIDSIFVRRNMVSSLERPSQSILMTRSPKLIRSSFGSLQLICSDFLSSLPNGCFLILVDTLYKFCSQSEDLNIALTTVTFFWVLSDFLSGRNKSLSITSDLMHGRSASDLAEMAEDPEHSASDAALWMLLLLRLTTVTADDRLELRNSAIQTLLRIFDAYGDRLTPEAWSICIKSVIFKLLSSIEEELKLASEGGIEDSDRAEWNDTAVVVLNGISSLLANYLDVLSEHPSFNSLWKELLSHFGTLLDFKALSINTATFGALGKILSQTHEDKSVFSKETIDFAWELWSRAIPSSREEAEQGADNQPCLTAYVTALLDVYRLIHTDLNVERVGRMLVLLREAMQQASVGSYVMDVEYATPLQGKILDAVKMVRTDLQGVPSSMISQVAEFVSLAFSSDAVKAAGSSSQKKRTFVAMSKTSMSILEALVLRHASDPDIYVSGALASAMSALARPISLKYGFPIVTKSIQPWRQATLSGLSILEATIPQLIALDIPQTMIQNIWGEIVTISNGIISANADAAPPEMDIVSDQDFDIESFQKLRSLVIPALGSDAIQEKARKVYAESLFRTSLIHNLAPKERKLVREGQFQEALRTALHHPVRTGRSEDLRPTKRSKMAYVCLDELFSLVSSRDAPTPTIVVQPPTPHFRGPTLHHREHPDALGARIARSAGPFLILRCALALRSYAADTPLRGRMPQPASQRKELVHILRKLVELRSEGGAMGVAEDEEGGGGGGRGHLVRLYPLLAGCVGVGADVEIQKWVQRGLSDVGAEIA